MKKQKQRSDHGNGWVKMNRSEIVDEVIAKNKNAWCLLSLIAKRAWRGPGINRHGCHVGEGFIGDYKEYGFTQMGYRVAKKQLEKFGLVSFRTTNRGTIAKLLGPESFDINVDLGVTDRAEGPTEGQQRAIKGPSRGHRRTLALGAAIRYDQHLALQAKRDRRHARQQMQEMEAQLVDV